jgi:hypothetical protein
MLMMSATNFALTGRLNGLELGGSKASFLSELGEPSWWEGMPSMDFKRSTLWKYGPVQIVFDAENRAISLAINFDAHQAADPVFRESPRLDSEMDFRSFVAFLTREHATYVESTDHVGRRLLCVDGGAIAVFSHRTDFERSVAEGRGIRSKLPYLVSLRVGKNTVFGTRPAV